MSVEDIWYGSRIRDRAMRGLLLPASWLYGSVARARAWRFANVEGACVTPAIPALSLGNITVGGTGKTPVAAWVAASLRARGGKPAIVMRGYGDDESLVHARVNPDVPVVVDADRVRGAERARALGADCVVLDDAFQHGRIARVSDWVLVAAERWSPLLQTLPAGPLREPLSAAARADVLLVTRKSATAEHAAAIAAALAGRFPHIRVATCALVLGDLVNALTGERRALSWLHGRPVGAVAAIGEPSAFFAQVRAAGARVTERAFRDHHRYDEADIRSLTELAGRNEGLVCTLKDAVKLASQWPPAAAPLWYVSQITAIEQGREVLDDALQAVLAARPPATSNAG